MKFFDFIDKYSDICGYYSDKFIVAPFQNKGYILWCSVSFDAFMNYVIKASKTRSFATGYACVNAGRIDDHTLDNFRVLDKVNMDLRRAKIQEVYA